MKLSNFFNICINHWIKTCVIKFN